MFKFAGVRLVRSIGVLLGASALVFIGLRLAPGDPASAILGETGSRADIEAMKEALGLNAGILSQFWRFLLNAVQGQLGVSSVYSRPVLPLVMEALKQSMILSLAAFSATILLAVPMGISAATRPGGAIDRLTSALVVIGQAFPSFWIGFMLIFLFALELGWFPTSGKESISSVVLPAVTLAIYQFPLLARTVRASMSSVLREDFVQAAWARGLSTKAVVLRYGFMNVLMQIVAILALQMGMLISGTIITEAVFGWPGLGTMALSAILYRDYALVQCVVLVCAAIVVVLNFLADLVGLFLDPRIQQKASLL